MSGTDTPSAEHRFLSVMFCDMVDSTSHVFGMEAEQFAELLSAYRHIVFEKIRRHGGSVARVIGDGVLAYFGWPQASGRDAHAAVACALEIAAAMPHLDSPVAVSVRIAVETGWLLVGAIGVDQGLDSEIEHSAAVGPAPHIAARLQALARPNGVIAGEATLRLLGTRFSTEPADTTGIRLPMPISAAHILGEAGTGDPLARLRVSGLALPIGRDAELAILRGSWEQARDGKGQVVLLSGDPGMGKSLLLGTLLNEIGTARGIVALFCRPSSQDSPFQPMVEPLRRAIGLGTDDDPAQIHARAAEFTRSLGLENNTYVMALATLLGAPPTDPPPPTVLRRHIQDTLMALVNRLVCERPLVILAEDVHWADPSTVDLLHKLADSARFTRLLLIVTYRRDHVMPWADRAHMLRLALSPLSVAAARRLAGDLASTLGLVVRDQQFADIIARAEGVPLFVEEFVRALADKNAPIARLPGSVAQLLVARLDSLGSARSVAQVASVLGREAPVEVLQALSGMTDDDFEDVVRRLIDSGVMTRRGVGDGALLEFHHALLGDAAYEAMPSDRRRVLHSAVADTLRQVRPSLATSEPEALARHYAAADRTSEASELFRYAAANALSSAAFIEAQAHARRALDLAEMLSDTLRDEAVLAALVPLGEALIATRGYTDPKVQEVFERGARLALTMGTAREMLPVLRGLTSFYQVRGPLWMARLLSERVLQIARVIGEPLLLAQAERRHGWCRMCEGDLTQARLLLEAALARQTAVGDADASQELAFDDATTLGTLAWLDWLTDGVAAAMARAEQAAARAENSMRPLSAAYSLGFAAIAHQLVGDPDGAERLAARCGAIAAERGFVYWTVMADALHGWSEAVRDRSPAGVMRLRQAVAEYRRIQSEILRPYLLTLLAEAEHATGSDAAAHEALDLAESVATAIGARLFLPELLMLRGRLLGGVRSFRALSAARQEALAQGATNLAMAAAAELACL